MLHCIKPVSANSDNRNQIAYGFAICQYEDGGGYYLFSCNDDLNELADTWHETIDEAIDQVDYNHPGVLHNWVKI